MLYSNLSMTKLIKLIGYPLGHSVSPAMQNTAFQQLSLDYKYELEQVAPDKLEEVVAKLKNDPNIAGFNVTVPYKEKILPFLDELSASAKLIGAVNTVVVQNKKLIGHNTDGQGFIASLKEEAGFDPKNKTALVIGAGGGSRAICLMLMKNGLRSLSLMDIDLAKAKTLSAEINCSVVDPNKLQEMINKADLLVNATPIGMSPNIDQSPLADNISIPDQVLVYDLIYNPAVTKLMKKAKLSCTGLGMLVHQGALAFEIWTNQPAPLTIMRQAAEQALFSA